MNNVGASVGSVLVPAGLDKSVGLITAAVLKDPTDPQWKDDPAMQEWRAFMAKLLSATATSKDATNVYGYAAAQTMVQVLKQCGDDLTRENVMKQAANIKNLELPLLLPGIKHQHQRRPTSAPIKQGQLARFDGKQWAGLRRGDRDRQLSEPRRDQCRWFRHAASRLHLAARDEPAPQALIADQCLSASDVKASA